MTGVAIIAALDEARGIGKGGELPWRLRGDMLHFVRLTKGSGLPPNAVVMGRRTWDSIPAPQRPLRDRVNLVVTRNRALGLPEGATATTSLNAALEKLNVQRGRGEVGDVFVIGGATLYSQALELDTCATLFLTRIEATFECDTFFPPFEDRFEIEERSETMEENGIRYRFEKHHRRAR